MGKVPKGAPPLSSSCWPSSGGPPQQVHVLPVLEGLADPTAGALLQVGRQYTGGSII